MKNMKIRDTKKRTDNIRTTLLFIFGHFRIKCAQKIYVFISYIIKFHISPLVKKGGRFLALPFSVPSFWWGLTSFFQFSLFGGDSPLFLVPSFWWGLTSF